ncbi:DNA-binding transcriptional LysR family regulator [Variovorax paradoxus]|uniref:LysR family transcriptional regulator n=1 Tax=Variovorax paradoxus TaxID=34073 RepID=UPI00278F69FB|nr:LysR family transcriptional regulator [Variovorax paradoxus]MDQ0573725.1 DNA-binding transcriptional LysR family regulator [Variovorax paradoxus]
MLDSQQLRAFVSVADHASVTRAAEAMHLTQSAVSAQIRRLEEQLGCRVFDRTTRSLQLTAQGSVLLSYARSILSLQQQAVSRLAAPRHAPATLRLGCSEGFPCEWLFAALAGFRQRRPDVHVEVTGGISTVLARQVRQRSLDLMVGTVCDAGSDTETLWMEPLVWAFSEKALLSADSPAPLAFLSEPCPFREAALASLAGHGSGWQIVLTAQSSGALVAAAAAGLAITVLTPSGMPPSLRAIPPGSFLPALPPARFVIQRAEGSTAPEPLAALVDEVREACFRWRGAHARATA